MRKLKKISLGYVDIAQNDILRKNQMRNILGGYLTCRICCGPDLDECHEGLCASDKLEECNNKPVSGGYCIATDCQ